jgi:hypothetical protein
MLAEDFSKAKKNLVLSKENRKGKENCRKRYSPLNAYKDLFIERAEIFPLR